MLSVALIKSLKPEDKKRHTDRDGLVLELRPNKKKLSKVFIFRFQWDKKPQTITIGKFPNIELVEAREIGLAYRALVDKGIDPRAKNVDAEQTKITFSLVAEQWFQKYKSPWKDFARNRHEKSLLRDTGIAHRKGKNYEKAIEKYNIPLKNLSNGFSNILLEGADLLNALHEKLFKNYVE